MTGKIMIIYNEIKEILERMDINVDNPKHARNPNKLGQLGMKCSMNNNEEPAWIILKPNIDSIEIIPPLFRIGKASSWENYSSNEELSDLLNRVSREYMLDNKNILLGENLNFIDDMNDMLRQFNLIYRQTSRFKNIKILRNSFHKNYIQLDMICYPDEKGYIRDSSSGNIKHALITLTKSNDVKKRRKDGWSVVKSKNNNDTFMLVNNKSLKTFNTKLKETIFKDIC